MSLAPCPFCTHSNPAGARFCNECGSPLHLLPCEQCDAVNDVLSRVCYRCGAPLRSERQLELIGAPAFASVGDTTAERGATTVVLAYGDEPKASPRPMEAWRPSRADLEQESPSMRDQAVALEAAPADEREPRMDTFAAVDDAEARGARRASTSAHPYLTFIAAAAIVGLAGLGGYTFIQRGEEPLEASPLPPPIPAPATVDSPTTPAELPQAREPALPQIELPTSSPPTSSLPTSSPSTASQPSASQPSAPTEPTTSQPTQSLPPAETSPGVASDAGKVSLPASPSRADRKPAPVSKPSQDAIETERIIMRELGSFAPPTR